MRLYPAATSLRREWKRFRIGKSTYDVHIIYPPAEATSINKKVPQEVRIGFLVHDVSRMRRTLFDQAMKPLGITRSQWWVLSQLSRHARSGMLQTELARDLDVGKVTVGGLIDRLEAAGYVVRRPEKTDRRAKRIMITPRGHEILDDMVAVGRKLNGVILAGLTPEAVAATEQALETMKENIRGAVAEKDEVELPVGIFAANEAPVALDQLVQRKRRMG